MPTTLLMPTPQIFRPSYGPTRRENPLVRRQIVQHVKHMDLSWQETLYRNKKWFKENYDCTCQYFWGMNNLGWLLGSGGKVKHVCLLSSNPSMYIKTVSSKRLLSTLQNPSMYIRTVSSKRLLSTLQNQIKIVYGRVWMEKHAQYTQISDPDQPGRKPM